MMDKKEVRRVLGDELSELSFTLEKAKTVNEVIYEGNFFTSDEKEAIENFKKMDRLVAVVEEYLDKACKLLDELY